MYGEGDCLLGMKQRGKSAASNACQTRGQTGLNGRADVENQKRDYIPARARPVSISGEGGGARLGGVRGGTRLVQHAEEFRSDTAVQECGAALYAGRQNRNAAMLKRQRVTSLGRRGRED
jgi:hypothetical protein